MLADTNEPYLQYYQYLLRKTNQELPQVISNSYGDDEESVPKNYAIRVCNLIGMMGLRGITVIESSGDTGVGATCRANTGKKLPRFTPQFPGTCPYILAVGGTQNIPEIAWVGSSGGFSDYFPRPAYQETAINTYLDDYVSTSTALYYSQFANFSGRGFPDVSAMSVSPYCMFSSHAHEYMAANSISRLRLLRWKVGEERRHFCCCSCNCWYHWSHQ